MKRILSLLLAILFLFLTSVSISAKNIDDLRSVCSGLKQYLYTPYVSDSDLYPAYSDALAKAEKLISKNTADADEVDAHYNALKSAFVALFRDCFDYSSLDQIAKDYETLSVDLFEEESWARLASAMDAIYNEINSPTVFKKGNMNKEAYALNIEKFINDLYINFAKEYSRLELKPLSENIAMNEAVALLNYCKLSAPEPIMAQSQNWSRYQNACEQLTALSIQRNPKQEDISLAVQELIESYHKLSVEFFDLSPVQSELKRYHSASSNQYSESSWAAYQKQIEGLQSLEKNPQFLYLNNFKDKEEALAYNKSFFSEKAKSAAVAFESLIPRESINKLSSLCNTYRRATASPGVEVKLKFLLESVNRGDEVLKNANSSLKDVEEAINEIENAAENLILAEEYLSSEQGNNSKSDTETMRAILVFTLLTLILSSICACFFSYRKFGRINWKR